MYRLFLLYLAYKAIKHRKEEINLHGASNDEHPQSQGGDLLAIAGMIFTLLAVKIMMMH
ncbi:hypothetical protein ['Paenibacillus yunnanensis' Narsing Rao et al. 2020]|uniref:hypothetical protein n=1 Tax=Paenibacillus tengchongensis TaxID=2608684 RepID=UPI00165248D8|nr:hypothetical protein [Paenibacillus tengchongensis]